MHQQQSIFKLSKQNIPNFENGHFYKKKKVILIHNKFNIKYFYAFAKF